MKTKEGMLVLRVTRRMQAALKRAARLTQAKLPEGYVATMSSVAISYIAAGLKKEERDGSEVHRKGLRGD